MVEYQGFRSATLDGFSEADAGIAAILGPSASPERPPPPPSLPRPAQGRGGGATLRFWGGKGDGISAHRR